MVVLLNGTSAVDFFDHEEDAVKALKKQMKEFLASKDFTAKTNYNDNNLINPEEEILCELYYKGQLIDSLSLSYTYGEPDDFTQNA